VQVGYPMKFLLKNRYIVFFALILLSACNGTGTVNNQALRDGGAYSGRIVAGLPHGRGTRTMANGDTITADYINGKPSGRGILTYNSGYYAGRKLEVEIRDGKMVGKFVMGLPNGDTMTGVMVNGQPKYKTYTYSNGDHYEGGFFDELFSGEGKFTHADGRVREGTWNSGVLNSRHAISQADPDKKKNSPKEKPKTITRKADPTPVPKPNQKPTPPSSTSGSGFFVSKLGHVITNQHVVGKCQSVTVGDSAKKQVNAEILDTDMRNDLALLKISSTKMASDDTMSLIRKLGIKIASRNVPLSSNGLLRPEDVELGERVMVSGYPFGEIFSDTIKVTGGMVSATRGMGDDSGQFQIDAAVQPGNSGGPIYDGNGNIVGVVVSQLNKLKVAKVIGSLPENVNFGIKASTVRQFLTSAGLPTKWSQKAKPISSKNLAKIARNQTLMVICNM